MNSHDYIYKLKCSLLYLKLKLHMHDFKPEEGPI